MNPLEMSEKDLLEMAREECDPRSRHGLLALGYLARELRPDWQQLSSEKRRARLAHSSVKL